MKSNLIHTAHIKWGHTVGYNEEKCFYSKITFFFQFLANYKTTHVHIDFTQHSTVHPNLPDLLSCDELKESTRGSEGKGCHYIGWGVSFDLKEIGCALMESFSARLLLQKREKQRLGNDSREHCLHIGFCEMSIHFCTDLCMSNKGTYLAI